MGKLAINSITPSQLAEQGYDPETVSVEYVSPGGKLVVVRHTDEETENSFVLTVKIAVGFIGGCAIFSAAPAVGLVFFAYAGHKAKQSLSDIFTPDSTPRRPQAPRPQKPEPRYCADPEDEDEEDDEEEETGGVAALLAQRRNGGPTRPAIAMPPAPSPIIEEDEDDEEEPEVPAPALPTGLPKLSFAMAASTPSPVSRPMAQQQSIPELDFGGVTKGPQDFFAPVMQLAIGGESGSGKSHLSMDLARLFLDHWQSQPGMTGAVLLLTSNASLTPTDSRITVVKDPTKWAKALNTYKGFGAANMMKMLVVDEAMAVCADKECATIINGLALLASSQKSNASGSGLIVNSSIWPNQSTLNLAGLDPIFLANAGKFNTAIHGQGKSRCIAPKTMPHKTLHGPIVGHNQEWFSFPWS